MRRLACLLALAAITGCGGGGGGSTTTGNAPVQSATASASLAFHVPSAPPSPSYVPQGPPNVTPTMPPPAFAVPAIPSLKSRSSARSTLGLASSFFTGQVALSNGVYYLQLPNSTVFGYYAFIPNYPQFMYHFDMGYEYIVDAADGRSGVYMYDFASGDWWYTSPTYAFPYVYDFTLNSVLYYYPDSKNVGHYTTNPRYFYNYATKSIITLPAGPTPAPSLPALPLSLNVNNLPGQFYGEILAQFSGTSPRHMVMLPNGDLLVGTGGGTASFAQSGTIYIIPSAESAVPAAPTVFATLSDASCSKSAGTNTNGIAFAPSTVGGTIFVGMECSVWKIPYVTGDKVASSAGSKFMSVRTGSTVATTIDKDVHHTTSLLAVGSSLYVSVGSSCNACIETDPTRAAILKADITSAAYSTVATRVRNALALAVNTATGTVWAGGAGQDCVVGTQCFSAMDTTYLNNGHPYEWMDPLSKRGAAADYMWPWCEENGSAVTSPDGTPVTPPAGTNCATMIVAPVRGPAYSTIMAATFYNPPSGATYAFPAAFNGGMFMTLHGSWHESTNGIPVAVPEVVFVPMVANTDTTYYPMDWTNGGNPYSTWARSSSGNPAPFMNGFQQSGTRSGRPVGLAVGPSGSLFISDDTGSDNTTGAIYRIRPGIAPAVKARFTGTATLRR